MILAACPGGVTAAMITDLSRGDTCLSITLTACTSLLSFITVPIIVGFSLMHFLGESAPVDYPMGQAVDTVLGAMGLLIFRVDSEDDLAVAAGAALSACFKGGQGVALILTQRFFGAKVF